MISLARILKKLPKAKITSDGWSDFCPAHEDSEGELSIVELPGNQASVTCHAGCKPEVIFEKLGIALTGLTLPAISEPDSALVSGPTFQPGPILTCMATVKARKISWLWPGRIPMGRLTLLVGRPGEGKSYLTTDMAARISKASPWPDGSDCPQGSVILVSAEDDAGDTIRPRLDAHGADVNKVHLLLAIRSVDAKGSYERLITLADIGAIEDALKTLPDCKLIVVDPIGSFLGGNTDSHRDNEVRAVLAPVAQLAEKYGPSVLVVAHRRKGSGSNADDLAMGSRAFTGIARAVWHLSRDSVDKSRRLLLPGKNNLSEEGTGLAFYITGDPAVIVWEKDAIKMNADEALAVENGGSEDKRPGPEAVKLRSAANWLRELLVTGQMEVAKIKEEATNAGFAWRTMQRAKDELDVSPYRREFSGTWIWELPANPACQGSLGENDLASWHDSNKSRENDASDPVTIGACQDDLSRQIESAEEQPPQHEEVTL